MPPAPFTSPEYPFHMLVADYCDIKGKTWLVTADRFSGWVSVYYFPKEASSKGLIKVFGDIFTTFGEARLIQTVRGMGYNQRSARVSLEA